MGSPGLRGWRILRDRREREENEVNYREGTAM
jgi:hypothetical protein